ncbi:hypothetical protein SAY87_024513 [Trapa incisa]|uniref:Uncharacterized protein n=1 Tax=Trapa incisa TaxID=236973 RepID=A0AAN7GEH5_9MYRT|nr:hypothetical protein SAY87_024513 [Trapa incisa]
MNHDRPHHFLSGVWAKSNALTRDKYLHLGLLSIQIWNSASASRCEFHECFQSIHLAFVCTFLTITYIKKSERCICARMQSVTSLNLKVQFYVSSKVTRPSSH